MREDKLDDEYEAARDEGRNEVREEIAKNLFKKYMSDERVAELYSLNISII